MYKIYFGLCLSLYFVNIGYCWPLTDHKLNTDNDSSMKQMSDRENVIELNSSKICFNVSCTTDCCSRIKGPYYELYCCSGKEMMWPRSENWMKRFSAWSMWYFWFAIVLTIATCFTGCNYWCRQRRLHQLRFMQRHYSTINGNSASIHAVIFPIIAYDAATSLMEDSRVDTCDNNNSLSDCPPSYREVTSKPDMYPRTFYKQSNTDVTLNNAGELPTYDSLSS